MATTTYAEFDKEYRAFAIKHNRKANRSEETWMDGSRIYKIVTWTDGAQWFEITETDIVEKVKADVEVHGLKITIEEEIPLRKTEYWSTEKSISRYFYRKG